MRHIPLLPLCVLIVLPAFARSGNADQQPTDRASLYARLDSDYLNLLAADKDPKPLRDAADLIARTDQSSNWTNYAKALEIIRQHRAKAAIPLLMKYVVEHAGLSTSHVVIPQYIDAITVLSGHKPQMTGAQGPNRAEVAEQDVIQLYNGWWQPNKNALTTSLDKMTDDQIQCIAQLSLEHARLQVSRNGSERRTSVQVRYQNSTMHWNPPAAARNGFRRRSARA